MFKPLLRVLPTLSGNVKLACNLLDYIQVSDVEDIKTFETNIRYAKLYPISSSSWNKRIDAGLLGSSWEFDIKKFYDTYSDIFYSDQSAFNKSEMLKLDPYHDMKVRSQDFEYGVKRISYSKQGNQFACFAPIYIDSIEDIPSHFLLTVELDNGTYKTQRNIKINIGSNSTDKFNYLTNYIESYVSKIDNNVLFCLPQSKQATFYGIDVKHGGFNKCKDNAVSILYSNQNTMQNFDAMLCNGFKRNKMVMKQILPLSFYFNVNDILTDREKYQFRNCRCKFSGNYYTKSGKRVDFYDFSFDYDEFSHDILKMDTTYGTMEWFNGSEKNVMDVGFPSLNEGRYYKYQFANKLSPSFCRWKLKYSDDEHPYIANMSWAYSSNQDSNYKYGQFPVTYSQLEGLADYIQVSNIHPDFQYNVVFPFGEKQWMYDNYNKSISKDYKGIQDNYCLNWFNIVNNIEDGMYEDQTIWRDMDDNCVYYNGILYDLSNVYNSFPDPVKVDKFAMLVLPDVDVLDWKRMSQLKFADYTLVRQATSTVVDPNSIANDSLLSSAFITHDPGNYLYLGEEYGSDKRYQDELQFNGIFTYAYTSGEYVDLNENGVDYYEINKYYDAEYVVPVIESANSMVQSDVESGNVAAYFLSAYMDLESSASLPVIDSYLHIPIYRASTIAYNPDDHIQDYIDHDRYLAYCNSAYVDNPEMLEWCKEQALAYEHPYDNAYIINAPDFTDYLGENLYYHPYSDIYNAFYKCKKDIEIEQDDEVTTYSYLSAGSTKFMDSMLGNTFYVKHKFYKASYIGDLHDKIPEEQFATYVNTKGAIDNEIYGVSYWKMADISDPTNYDEQGNVINPLAYSAILYKTVDDYRSYIVDHIDNAISEVTDHQYTFAPVLQAQGITFTGEVFQELSYNAGKFSGDFIQSQNANQDRDVLWVDIYNLERVYNKFAPGKMLRLDKNTSYEFYANFLDKLHVYYFYAELFKDETASWDESKQNAGLICEDKYELHNLDFVTERSNDDSKESFVDETETQNMILEDKWVKLDEIFNIVTEDSNSRYAQRLTCDYQREGLRRFLLEERTDDDPSNLVDESSTESDTRYIVPEYTLENTEWYKKYWHEGIFIKRKVWIDDQTYCNHPVVKFIYRNIYDDPDRSFMSFIDWYAALGYDPEDGLFFYWDKPEDKFELCFRKRFFRADEVLWDITNMEELLDEFDSEVYHDIYFYRMQHDREWDLYNAGKLYTRYVTSFDSLVEQKYDVGAWDTCLIPMFDDIFAQDVDDAYIFVHLSLHNITKTWNDLTKSTNYRYDHNHKLMMVKVSEEEKQKYNLTKTYTNYNNTWSKLDVVSDDLGYGSLGLSTKVMPDGTKYGFYVVRARFNNTSDSFNITGTMDGELVYKLKYFYYVNGVNVMWKPDYFKSLTKEIVPFSRLDLLAALQNVNTIIYPNTYNIDLVYRQSMLDNSNGSSEMDITRYPKTIKTISLQRYMHSFTPLITKTVKVPNQYKYKLKNVDRNLLDRGIFNSIGDSPIYKSDESINNFRPYNVYTTSVNEIETRPYNNKVSEFTPVEYKHYDASRYMNLEETFTIQVGKQLTYNELLNYQTREFVFSKFKEHVNGTRSEKYDDGTLLFLLDRYEVLYDSVPTGLNVRKTEKLHSLNLVFKLL